MKLLLPLAGPHVAFRRADAASESVGETSDVSRCSQHNHLRTGVGKAFQALALTFIPVRGGLPQTLASYL
jgi:hypothetical protein